MKMTSSEIIIAQGLEIRITPIKKHWAAYANGSRFRCQIGKWNFDGTAFIASAQADGVSIMGSEAAARHDLANPAKHIPEDSQGLGI